MITEYTIREVCSGGPAPRPIEREWRIESGGRFVASRLSLDAARAQVSALRGRLIKVEPNTLDCYSADRWVAELAEHVESVEDIEERCIQENEEELRRADERTTEAERERDDAQDELQCLQDRIAEVGGELQALLDDVTDGHADTATVLQTLKGVIKNLTELT